MRLVKYMRCNMCEEIIGIDESIRSKNGKKIPLNMDKTRHECPNSDYALRKNEDQMQNSDSKPSFTTADILLEENIIEHVKCIIQVINEKLKRHNIIVVINDI